jgi:hypothetical protein
VQIAVTKLSENLLPVSLTKIPRVTAGLKLLPQIGDITVIYPNIP